MERKNKKQKNILKLQGESTKYDMKEDLLELDLFRMKTLKARRT